MTDATCGSGLAEHATLPGCAAAVFAAMAENLRLHQATLDLRDPRARREHEVYVALEVQYRDIVSRLVRVADAMTAARDLPMGRHLPDKLADAALHHAFVDFVQKEADLAALLERDLERDRAMLRSTR